MSDQVSNWYSSIGNERRLQDQVNAAASSTSGLSGQINDLRRELNDLKRQVAQLSTTAYATEAKAKLNEYDPARRIRDAVLAAISDLTAGRPLSGDLNYSALTDEPGYWLGPLAHGLPGLMTGKPDAALLDQAKNRDATRSATFLAAAGFMLGSTPLIVAWLPAALAPGGSGSTTAEMSAGQRVLWLAAEAHPDPAVQGIARQAIQAAVAGADPAERAALVTALAGRNPMDSKASGGDPAGVMRGWAEFGEQLAAIPADATSTPSDLHALLTALLQSVTAEGSEPELSLLNSTEPNRSKLINLNPASPLAWNAPVGSALQVLGGDLDLATPDRARRSLEMIRPEIMAAIQNLQERVAVPPAGAIVRRISGVDITITEQGVQPADWAKTIESNWPAPRPLQSSPEFWVGCVVGVLGVIAAIMLHPLFAVLTVGALVYLITVAVRIRNNEKQTTQTRNQAVDTAKNAVDQAKRELAAKVAAVGEQTAAATKDAARVRAALA